MSLRLSESAKSNIDIFVPTIGAALAFYYLKQYQKLKLERLLIYTAIAWLVLWFLTKRITTTLRNNTTAPPDVLRTNTDEVSAIPISNFNASAYSDRIYQDIKGVRWGQILGVGTDDTLYKELAIMSNDQLIQVANQYKKDYYAKLGETLIQSLESETYNNLFTGTQDRVNAIITRLKALGFN